MFNIQKIRWLLEMWNNFEIMESPILNTCMFAESYNEG